VILDWNERAEKMFGWPREKSLGRTLAELIIPERYRERTAAAWNVISRAGKVRC